MKILNHHKHHIIFLTTLPFSILTACAANTQNATNETIEPSASIAAQTQNTNYLASLQLVEQDISNPLPENEGNTTQVDIVLDESTENRLSGQTVLLAGGNSVISVSDEPKRSSSAEFLTYRKNDDNVMLQTPPPATRVFNFTTNSTEVNSEDGLHLSEHAAYLANNSELTLTIRGHADNRGSDQYNKALSRKRAEVIVDLLKGYGAPEAQILILALGADSPLTDVNRWDENRRVELNYSAPYKLSSRY